MKTPAGSDSHHAHDKSKRLSEGRVSEGRVSEGCVSGRRAVRNRSDSFDFDELIRVAEN